MLLLISLFSNGLLLCKMHLSFHHTLYYDQKIHSLFIVLKIKADFDEVIMRAFITQMIALFTYWVSFLKNNCVIILLHTLHKSLLYSLTAAQCIHWQLSWSHSSLHWRQTWALFTVTSAEPQRAQLKQSTIEWAVLSDVLNDAVTSFSWLEFFLIQFFNAELLVCEFICNTTLRCFMLAS